jgi:predicted ferric reductase
MFTHLTSQTDSSPWFKVLSVALGSGLIIILLAVVAVAILSLSQSFPATSDKTYWFISRSSGILAYMMLTAAVLWGLVQSGGILRPTIPPLLALGMHSFLNWGSLVMAALHGLILLGDHYLKLTLFDVIVPFSGPYEPALVGLGVLAFYLMLLLSSSFYVRKWLGQKTFRWLHYASYPTYLLVSLHGLGVGTDSGLLWPLYLASVGLVVLVTIWRILNARQKNSSARKP